MVAVGDSVGTSVCVEVAVAGGVFVLACAGIPVGGAEVGGAVVTVPVDWTGTSLARRVDFSEGMERPGAGNF